MNRAPSDRRVTLNKHKRSINKKEAYKKSENVNLMDEYLSYVNHLCNTKIIPLENAGSILDKSENKQKEIDRSKQYIKSNSKNNHNENQENKHIFKQILDKGLDANEGRNIFVISDDIEDDDPEKFSNEKKLEILLTKLLDEKNFINDKTFGANMNDLILNKIFIALSPDAKKLILENDPIICKEIQYFFHHLIGLNYTKLSDSPELTNEILTYLNNNLITIEDFQNNREKVKDREEMSSNIKIESTAAIETEDFAEDKIVFEFEKKSLLEKENNIHNKIINTEEIYYDYYKEILVSSSSSNDLDEIIDVFKSRELEETIEEGIQYNESKQAVPVVIKNSNKSNVYDDADNKAITGSILKKVSRSRIIINNSVDFVEDNIPRNSILLKVKESQNKENPKDQKNNLSSSNPFKQNYEADGVNSNPKGNKVTSYDRIISKVNFVGKINPNKVKPVKGEFKDKKRMIELNNKKTKFTNFEDEDSDW